MKKRMSLNETRSVSKLCQSTDTGKIFTDIGFSALGFQCSITGPALERVGRVEIHPSIFSNGWHPPVLKLDDLFLESNF